MSFIIAFFSKLQRREVGWSIKKPRRAACDVKKSYYGFELLGNQLTVEF